MDKVIRMPPRSRPRVVTPLLDAARAADDAKVQQDAVKLATPLPLTLEERLARLDKHTSGKLATTYLQIRDAKRKLEAEAKELGHKLDVLEMAILARLQKEEQDGYTAQNMVLYKYTLTTARVLDGKVLVDFVLEDPAHRIDILERRASKDGMRNWMDLHPEYDKKTGVITTPPPPGTELAEFVKLGVRKK